MHESKRNIIENLIIENIIIKQFVKDVISAGFVVTVFNGIENTVSAKNDADTVMGALRDTDQETLYIHTKCGPKAKFVGWVDLVYGNGHDVIGDWTTGLNDLIRGAQELSDRFAEKGLTFEDWCEMDF